MTRVTQLIDSAPTCHDAPVTAAAYLARIGLSTATAAIADAATLTRIATAHLAHVPFENLDLHAGTPVSIVLGQILDKVVTARRGGICYELNGGLCWLLGQLGYPARLHGARVRRPECRAADSAPYGPPLGHVAVVVDWPQPWLVDVGFGGDAVIGPLSAVATPDPAGARVQTLDDTGYLLETAPRPLPDFAAMAWWHSTSPQSRFTQSLICSLTRPEARYTLSGQRLKVTAGGLTDERDLDPAAALAAYSDIFGIPLDALPVALLPQ